MKPAVIAFVCTCATFAFADPVLPDFSKGASVSSYNRTTSSELVMAKAPPVRQAPNADVHLAILVVDSTGKVLGRDFDGGVMTTFDGQVTYLFGFTDEEGSYSGSYEIAPAGFAWAFERPRTLFYMSSDCSGLPHYRAGARMVYRGFPVKDAGAQYMYLFNNPASSVMTIRSVLETEYDEGPAQCRLTNFQARMSPVYKVLPLSMFGTPPFKYR